MFYLDRYISGAKDCDANTCEYLLTYEREGNLANFELSAKADWVAVGFSSDDRMVRLIVYSCYFQLI